MVLELPAINPAVGLFLAQQLTILREGTNPSLIGANIAADTGRFNSQGDIPATPRYPRGWWVRDSDKTYVFINGTENLGQATAYVQYVSDPVQGFAGGQQTSRYLTDANDNYLTPLGSADFGSAGTFLVTGHSLGGVFAQQILLASRVREIRTARSAVTFGSPKFVQGSHIEFYRGLDIIRWMNDNDPVADVPPAVVSNIASYASLGIFTLQNWSRTAQLQGGVSVRPDGTTQDVAVPPNSVLNFGSSLANWLWNVYNGRQTVHDLPEYELRLQNVSTRVNPPGHARVIESGPERPASLNHRDANRQIQASVDAIVHIAGQQNAAILGVPPSRAFVPVKIGPIWWVTFGGQLVAVGPRRKACGLMCVRGNEFLRRLQRMGGVDGNALGRLLVDYIESASTPDNGFTPTIARLDSF